MGVDKEIRLDAHPCDTAAWMGHPAIVWATFPRLRGETWGTRFGGWMEKVRSPGREGSSGAGTFGLLGAFDGAQRGDGVWGVWEVPRA